jgi:hypothetical protein
MWVLAVGGRGRAGSAAAAAAALGLLLVEPLARRVPRSTVALGKRRRQRTRQSDNWLLVVGVAAVAQLALGAFCATVSGRETDTMLSLLMTAPALVLLGAGAPLLLPVLPPGKRPARKDDDADETDGSRGSRGNHGSHRSHRSHRSRSRRGSGSSEIA